MLLRLLHVQFLFLNWKAALLLFLLLAMPVLVWAVRKKGFAFSKPVALGSVGGMLALLAPIDIQFRKAGHLAVDVVPIVWGFPDPSWLQKEDEGKVQWRGCMVPSNPPWYAVIVSHW
jgi:hypothetical protein